MKLYIQLSDNHRFGFTIMNGHCLISDQFIHDGTWVESDHYGLMFPIGKFPQIIETLQRMQKLSILK